MSLLRKYADQVRIISGGMRSGKISMSNGALRLRALAVLVEQDAAAMPECEYAERLKKMAEMIYNVVEKMEPGQRMVQ